MSNKKQDNLKYNPDLTEHDKDILNQDNVHGDGGDDQQLKDREKDTNFSKSNLDICFRLFDAASHNLLQIFLFSFNSSVFNKCDHLFMICLSPLNLLNVISRITPFLVSSWSAAFVPHHSLGQSLKLLPVF